MQRGNLIIYDETGRILSQTGEAEGSILPHEYPVGVPYIEIPFGTMATKRVVNIDVTVEPHEPIFEDLTTGVVAELTLEEIKAAKKTALSNRRDELLKQFTSSALGAEHTYKKDGQSDLELFATVKELLPQYPAETVQAWWVVDLARFEPHTVAQLQQVFNDYNIHFVTVWQTYAIKVTEIDEAETVDEVESIIW